MIDIKLDNNDDVAIENGDFIFVEEIEQVKQFLKTRIKTFFGECVFDTSKGVKYFEEIFVKEPNISVVDGIFKSVIINTPEVLEILEYESEINRSSREISVSLNVRTIFGDTGILEVTA